MPCCFTRLTTNNAAQAAHIAELDRQILAIDEDNLRLREFIQKEGILLPKHLRIAPQRAGSTSSPKAATSRGFGGGAGSGGKARSIASSRAYYGEEGYVEEVDVDVVENVSSSRHYADGGAAAVAQAAAPTKTLSTTLGMPKNSSTVQSSTSRPGELPARCSFANIFSMTDVLLQAPAPGRQVAWREMCSTSRPATSDRPPPPGAAAKVLPAGRATPGRGAVAAAAAAPGVGTTNGRRAIAMTRFSGRKWQ